MLPLPAAACNCSLQRGVRPVYHQPMLRSKFLLLLSACWIILPPRSSEGRDNEPDFSRWENDIAHFEEMDRAQQPPKGAILFVGSSMIVRWKTLAEDFPGHQVINRGFGGNQIADSTHFAERMIFPY